MTFSITCRGGFRGISKRPFAGMANAVGCGVSALCLVLVISGLGASRNYVAKGVSSQSGVTTQYLVMGTRDWCIECDGVSGCVEKCKNYWELDVSGETDAESKLRTAIGCSKAAFSFFFFGMLLNCGQIAQFAMDMEKETLAKAISFAAAACYLLALILAIFGPGEYIDLLKNAQVTRYPDWDWGASIWLYFVAFFCSLGALSLGLFGEAQPSEPAIEAKADVETPPTVEEPDIPSSAGAVMGVTVSLAPDPAPVDEGKV